MRKFNYVPITYIPVKIVGCYEYGVKKYSYKGSLRYRAYCKDNSLDAVQWSHEVFDDYAAAEALANSLAQDHIAACARTAARNAMSAHK